MPFTPTLFDHLSFTLSNARLQHTTSFLPTNICQLAYPRVSSDSGIKKQDKQKLLHHHKEQASSSKPHTQL
jgi:hypothetical protein